MHEYSLRLRGKGVGERITNEASDVRTATLEWRRYGGTGHRDVWENAHGWRREAA